MRQVFALDIGGTNVKYGVVSEDGIVTEENRMRTLAYEGSERLLARLKSVISEAWRDELEGVAISSAGQINPEDGSVRFATDNLPGWTGIRLADEVAELIARPCRVENDVNAAALGEYWLGAARGARNALMVTLGAGVGGGLVTDGVLFTGDRGGALEIGHVKLYPGGRKCTCGQNGCYEQYASTRALEKLVREKIPEMHRGARDLFDHIKAGNVAARRVYLEWVNEIALGLSSIVPMLDPDIVILGGAISIQGEALSRPVETLIKRMVMPSYRELTVKCAQLGNQAGMLGAAHAFFRAVG